MIVHAVLNLDVGGLERIVADLARHAGPAAVLCIERPGALAADLEHAGVPVVCLHKPPGRRSAFRQHAEKALQNLNATVLHTHQIGAAWYAAPAARHLGLRVVHTEHGNAFARARSPLGRLRLWTIYRQASKQIDACAAVAPEIALTLLRWRVLPPQRICVVPNGIRPIAPTRPAVEIRQQFNIPPDAFLAGTVGRLDEVKQQHLLLRALTALPGVHALFVGDGPEREPLQALAQKLGLTERVHWAGYQAHPVDFLAAMNAFVLPSRSEGFPVTLLEAWNCALPVVVSAVGGLKTIVRHGENGLLIPPGDVAGLANAIRQFLNDPTLARRLGTAGHQELIANYTFEAMTARYQKLYGLAASPGCNSPQDSS